MGSTTQKYSLKWNDFTVNVASTFRDLHSRHDFVDVTLACADGSTLEAHKVILSSVSTYFRDILKTTPCKHPIIILKDTGRDEASAMLEFAYTGEVNVAQELLQSFLHMARSFRIKGLDKVECPVDPPPQRLEAQTPSSEHWVESAPPTRSHTPSSIHSQQDVKPPFSDHFMAEQSAAAAAAAAANKAANGSPQSTNNHVNRGAAAAAAVEQQHRISSVAAAAMAAAQQAAVAAAENGGMNGNHSPPASLPNSRPPTREPSPVHGSAGPLPPQRTPPPKRWKRSFDMTHPSRKESSDNSLPAPENYSRDRDYDGPSKRFCEPNPGPRLLPYPHSMPTSPTMFERGNELRLAGLIRHNLLNDLPRNVPEGVLSRTVAKQEPPSSSSNGGEHHRNTSSSSSSHPPPPPHVHNSDTSSSYDPVDYRCFSKDRTNDPRSSDNENSNGPNDERFRMIFRPESAPTVLDMSPEGSLSGPPSVRNSMELNDSSLRDCVNKAFQVTPDGLGRYSCDECGKIFKHPGSLQHHRHIHRGTHRCPSCGKAFSRRWDMERHLNKSKYGCPANRFSTGSAPGGPSSTPATPESPAAPVSLTAVGGPPAAAILLSPAAAAAAAAASSVHNTTA